VAPETGRDGTVDLVDALTTSTGGFHCMGCEAAPESYHSNPLVGQGGTEEEVFLLHFGELVNGPGYRLFDFVKKE